jgi:hypothetical protein
MKKITVILSSAILLACSSIYATGFGIYWIGNSLMSGGWACYEGWDFVGKAMINPDSQSLGMVIHSAALKRGATDIPSHWQQDVAANADSCTGISELNNPTGCITYGYPEPWCAAQTHYDYLALQGYRWAQWTTPAAAMDTQIYYCSKYYDLGLSKGTKPIIFACWQTPASANAAIAIYDSLFRKYRSRGAIYAPVIQAHRLVWNDPTKDSLTYLYDNDPFHHVNKRGAFLMDCVFYEIFTGQSSVGITAANMKRGCSNDLRIDSMSAADITYLEQKAHQAVIDYYGAGNVPHLGITAVTIQRPVALKPLALYTKSGAKITVDLTGRIINHGLVTRSQIAIAKDAMGRANRVVMDNR